MASSRLGICVFFLVTTITSSAFALALSKQQNTYYGQAFYDAVARGERDQALIDTIRDTLTGVHVVHKGQMDEIEKQCPKGGSCVTQRQLSYEEARKNLFGVLHLVTVGKGYGVSEVYCDRTFTDSDFRVGDELPAPDTIPEDKVINCEHTWPQSRFSSAADKATQKSDLHHLYPTDNEMNSIRGNIRFAEVDVPDRALKCPTSKIGTTSKGPGQFFEPPDQHKGNVARALFYFSIRYRIHIDPIEEGFLKKWNHDDPVDSFDVQRNDRIQQIQGNRNPFVDHPELADAISDF